MRKPLVIGAVAVAVIGVGLYLLSQPRKGTVEWHKRELVTAESVIPAEKEKAAIHRKALVEAGYLVHRTVSVPSNHLPLTVYEDIRQILGQGQPARMNYDSFFSAEGDGTNWGITAPAYAIDAIADVLRRGGTPETR